MVKRKNYVEDDEEEEEESREDIYDEEESEDDNPAPPIEPPKRYTKEINTKEKDNSWGLQRSPEVFRVIDKKGNVIVEGLAVEEINLKLAILTAQNTVEILKRL